MQKINNKMEKPVKEIVEFSTRESITKLDRYKERIPFKMLQTILDTKQEEDKKRKRGLYVTVIALPILIISTLMCYSKLPHNFRLPVDLSKAVNTQQLSNREKIKYTGLVIPFMISTIATATGLVYAAQATYFTIEFNNKNNTVRLKHSFTSEYKEY